MILYKSTEEREMIIFRLDTPTVHTHRERIVDSIIPFAFALVGVYMGYDLGWWVVGVPSAAVSLYYGTHLFTAFAALRRHRRENH